MDPFHICRFGMVLIGETLHLVGFAKNKVTKPKDLELYRGIYCRIHISEYLKLLNVEVLVETLTRSFAAFQKGFHDKKTFNKAFEEYKPCKGSAGIEQQLANLSVDFLPFCTAVEVAEE